MYVCRDDNDAVFFIQQIGGGSLLSLGCVGSLFLLVRDVNHTIRYIRGVRRSLRRRGSWGRVFVCVSLSAVVSQVCDQGGEAGATSGNDALLFVFPSIIV